MSRPSITVFVTRERSVWRARAGSYEVVSTGATRAARLVASQALEVPESEIEFLAFSETCIRATVKGQRQPIDPIVWWAIDLALAAIVALWLLVKGGAS